MKFPKLAFLIGCVLAGSVLARTWSKIEGKEIEADFVKYDVAGKMVTIKSENKEQILALIDFSENDQK